MTETKNLLDRLMSIIDRILQRTISYDRVRRVIGNSYNRGITDVENDVKITFNLVPNEYAIDFLSEHTFENIKALNNDTKERLRKELVIGLTNREGTRQLRDRIRTVMNVSRSRASAIARTETYRAYNAGSNFAAKQTGLSLKKKVSNPNPESSICQHLVKQPPIGMNEKFSYDGSSWDMPPFHVNCRSRLLYVQEADA